MEARGRAQWEVDSWPLYLSLAMVLHFQRSSSICGLIKSLLGPSSAWYRCPLPWNSLFLKPLDAAGYLSSVATLPSPFPSGL